MKKLLLGLVALMALSLGACTKTSVRSIDHSYVDESGHLIIVYNDGTSDDAGYVKGEQGEQGPQGEPGEDGTDGQDGTDGTDGQNGNTPYIGENGNWWINGVDTGVPATGPEGPEGPQGPAGEDGAVVEITKKYNITIPETTNEFRQLLTIENTFEYLALYHQRDIDTGISFGPYCELMPPNNYKWWNNATISLIKNNINYGSWNGKEVGYYIVKNVEITNITYNNNYYPTYTLNYENIYTPLELLIEGE